MRLRTVAVTSLVAVAAAGALAPAAAAPKGFEEKYDAQATPDPTTSNVSEICDPVTPTAKHSTEFELPGPGTLKVELDNTLDWALGIRVDGELIASADGSSPETKEVASAKFKKATVVSVDACNFAGEPSVPVTVTFTPK